MADYCKQDIETPTEVLIPLVNHENLSLSSNIKVKVT